MAATRAADHTRATLRRPSMPTDPPPCASDSAPDDGLAFECFRYRVDGDAELFVAHLADSERMVASLRLEPVSTAPLSTLRRLGARVLPDPEGAYAYLAADPDAIGLAGLAAVTTAAFHARRCEAGDGFWLAACPDGLLPALVGQGWRPLPSGDARSAGPTAVVLLFDDTERFARLGSPLARVAAPARAARLGAFLEAFGLEPDGLATARRATH